MIRFRERNLPMVGLVSLIVIVVLVVGALEFAKLPLVNHGQTAHADFADAGGLVKGDVVTVDGVKVGTITTMSLHRTPQAGSPDGVLRVRVGFTVQDGVHLGSTTSAAAKVLSPIGTEYLELTPSGAGPLQGAIPAGRTTLPYNLVADLTQLGQQIRQYNIPQLQQALQVGANDIAGTSPAQVSSAFNGLAQLSKVIGNDSNQLATVVDDGAALSKVLSTRSGQLVDLVSQSNVVLQVLAARKQKIDELLSSTAALGHDITSILQTNSAPLHQVLGSLVTVSAILAQDSQDISTAIPLLSAFSRYTANATGSGAFADVAVPTLLLPDDLLKQCAAPGSYPSANPQVGCRR